MQCIGKAYQSVPGSTRAKNRSKPPGISTRQDSGSSPWLGKPCHRPARSTLANQSPGDRPLTNPARPVLPVPIAMRARKAAAEPSRAVPCRAGPWPSSVRSRQTPVDDAAAESARKRAICNRRALGIGNKSIESARAHWTSTSACQRPAAAPDHGGVQVRRRVRKKQRHRHGRGLQWQPGRGSRSVPGRP